MNETYDSLARLVNEDFTRTADIRETARNLNLSFDEVWEMTGMKDWYDFVENMKG